MDTFNTGKINWNVFCCVLHYVNDRLYSTINNSKTNEILYIVLHYNTHSIKIHVYGLTRPCGSIFIDIVNI